MELDKLNRDQLIVLVAEYAALWKKSEDRCRSANESALFWREKFEKIEKKMERLGTEGNAHVQGMPVEPASAGVPGSAGGEAGAVPGMR